MTEREKPAPGPLAAGSGAGGHVCEPPSPQNTSPSGRDGDNEFQNRREGLEASSNTGDNELQGAPLENPVERAEIEQTGEGIGPQVDLPRHTTETTADRTDDDGANEGRSLKNFIRAHRSCMVAVVVILTIMALTTVILIIKMEISQLSVAVAALSNMDIKVNPIVSYEKMEKTLGPGVTMPVGTPNTLREKDANDRVSGPPGLLWAGQNGSMEPGNQGENGPPGMARPTGPPGSTVMSTGRPEYHRTSAWSMSTTVLCPKGYREFRGICYKDFKAAKTFSEAATACLFDGGTLAQPKDADINAFLVSLHDPEDEFDRFWFGLHDRRQEGSFEWVDGTPLGKYNSWGQGQPEDRTGIEDCVGYIYINGQTSWFDSTCTFKRSFICQVTPGKNTME